MIRTRSRDYAWNKGWIEFEAPNAQGVYWLRAKDGQTIFVGKGNIRQRLLSHWDHEKPGDLAMGKTGLSRRAKRGPVSPNDEAGSILGNRDAHGHAVGTRKVSALPAAERRHPLPGRKLESLSGSHTTLADAVG